MARGDLASLLLALVFAVGPVACSDQSPVSPTAERDIPGSMARLVPVAGAYQLTFLASGQPVTSLIVGQQLVLKAHVEADISGAPAERGSVTFQYCSLRGGPSNDIERADEAPKSECETGTGSWARLQTVPVNTSGDAFIAFCCVSIPRTVGFRFKYAAKGSGIADGISEALDFTWVPAS